VACLTTAKTVTLYNSGKTATFTGPGHINSIAGIKDIGLYAIALLHIIVAAETHFP